MLLDLSLFANKKPLCCCHPWSVWDSITWDSAQVSQWQGYIVYILTDRRTVVNCRIKSSSSPPLTLKTKHTCHHSFYYQISIFPWLLNSLHRVLWLGEVHISHLLSPDPEINIPLSVSMKLIPQFKNCYNWEGSCH